MADLSKTILVDHFEANKFLVKDIATGDSHVLDESEFHGTAFKYKSEFERKFLRCFPGKTSITFTHAAEEICLRLMDANREGIFDE